MTHHLLPLACQQNWRPPAAHGPLKEPWTSTARKDHSCSGCSCSGSNLLITIPQQPTVRRPTPDFPSEARQTPLPWPPGPGPPADPAHGLHLAFKAPLHFLWQLLFPLSTYLVGFQDQPRLRLGYMEIEIDTVPPLFNLVKEKKKERKNSWLGWYLSSQESPPKKTLVAWTGSRQQGSPFQAQMAFSPRLRSSLLAGFRPPGCPLPPTSQASLAPNPPGQQPLPSPGSDTLLSPHLGPSQLQRPLDAPPPRPTTRYGLFQPKFPCTVERGNESRGEGKG